MKKGLGLYLDKSYGLTNGISLEGQFLNLRFTQQVELLGDKLLSYQLNGGKHLIANSFGAYLLLHAILKNPALGELKCLLLSPVLGQTQLGGLGRIPPQALKLKTALSTQKLTLENCTVATGTEDPVINWELMEWLTAIPNVKLHKLEKEGHQINPEKIASLINSWVNSSD